MTSPILPEQIESCFEIARSTLLDKLTPEGHWEGELSTSALSTATAVMALEMIRCGISSTSKPTGGNQWDVSQLQSLIDGGISWLVEHQNEDGGWGDTTKSLSNISTTMLAHAVFHATDSTDKHRSVVDAAKAYIDRVGGVEAVFARYGKDKTFSVPILTHCALAGLVDWKEVIPLPFELACLPAEFYKAVRLPVVSYALPALIAIGQARHYHRKSWNPLVRFIRHLAIRPSLRVLERVQPENGGFLEAAPLTSFVTMSLAAMGMLDHPVTIKGAQFLIDSVRPDGSWPIDTNLATWVTTLSVNALGDNVPETLRPGLRDWLLEQQYRDVHPYTNTDPGGWAWTDLPGGVPDADDTPGAILALLNLRSGQKTGTHSEQSETKVTAEEHDALQAGVNWLLDLQNRNKGWPTFCRGWGKLPFDRSAADLTAHAIRALHCWLNDPASDGVDEAFCSRVQQAIQKGFQYLAKTQRSDGSWLPLWFGNQFANNEENPIYGTSRVLAAYRDTGRLDTTPAQQAVKYLFNSQYADGGWGGAAGVSPSVEETALCVEILLSAAPDDGRTQRGLAWLLNRVENRSFTETTPIGFYFAKLWYFECLYPLAFTVSALAKARQTTRRSKKADGNRQDNQQVRQHAVAE